jgi:hypothetical protein
MAPANNRSVHSGLGGTNLLRRTSIVEQYFDCPQQNVFDFWKHTPV